MAATIKDIARLAGVSVGTVDRALNHRGHISQKTEERILEIAKSLNYSPNSVAKSLATFNKKTKIFVIFHVKTNDYYKSVKEGIMKAASEIAPYGISVVIRSGKDFDISDQLALLDQAVKEDASAIILVPINHVKITRAINSIKQKGIPIILLSTYVDGFEPLAYVGSDYNKSGMIAAGIINLVCGEKGNLLVFSPPYDILGHKQRIDGLSSQLFKEYPSVKILDIVQLPNDEMISYKMTYEALSSNPATDIILYMGASAKGGLCAINDYDSNHTIKLVFFDEPSIVKENILTKRISATIVQSPVSQGYQAVYLLFNYLVKGEKPKEVNCYIDSQIIIRENLL